jgi:hypothetical protein
LLIAKRRKTLAQAHKDVNTWESAILEAEQEAKQAAEEQRKVESLAVLHRYLAKAVEVAGNLRKEEASQETVERMEKGMLLAEVRPNWGFCPTGRICMQHASTTNSRRVS